MRVAQETGAMKYTHEACAAGMRTGRAQAACASGLRRKRARKAPEGVTCTGFPRRRPCCRAGSTLGDESARAGRACRGAGQARISSAPPNRTSPMASAITQ
jgi:hypothetical protein